MTVGRMKQSGLPRMAYAHLYSHAQAKLLLLSARIILLDLSCAGSFRSQHSKVLRSVWPSMHDSVHRYVYDTMLEGLDGVY